MEQELSVLEQFKRKVNPYDSQQVFARLAGGTVDDITPEDDIVLRWHGLYQHLPLEAGLFMLRIKLPGGALTAGQATIVASLAMRFTAGNISLTTRQNIELHRLTLAVLPTVFAELQAAGLLTLGACGDQVRNVVACPVAGIDPAELLDTTAVANALTAVFIANPAFANLPRKFKIALSGCAQHCVPNGINDLGLEATRDSNKQLGFVLQVGGGLSSHPVLATDLGVWIPVDDAVEVVSRAVEIFRDYGNRTQRSQARVKHLLTEHGIVWFRQQLEERLGHALLSRDTPAVAALQQDHLGINPQSDPALVYIGIPVPAGMLSSDQLQGLAKIASVTAPGRLRITHQQNIILADIPHEQVDAVLVQLAKLGLPVNAAHWRGSIVACTGKDFCNKALVHTKAAALRLGEALDKKLPALPISIRMSGCPNGCAQHAIADIGLQGTVTKGDTGIEERFDLLVGGGNTTGTQAFGRKLNTRLRPEELEGEIVSLLQRYRNEATDNEPFSAYAQRMLLPDVHTE